MGSHDRIAIHDVDGRVPIFLSSSAKRRIYMMTRGHHTNPQVAWGGISLTRFRRLEHCSCVVVSAVAMSL